MRGEFQQSTGLILPNNISIAGAQMVLAAALRNTVPTIYAGLVNGAPSPTMTEADTTEPTVGVNGYGRIAIARNAVDWEQIGVTGVEAYLRTKLLTWAAAGGNFSMSIRRIALFSTGVRVPANPVYALSAPLDADLLVGVATPLADREFRYSLYI